MSGAWWSRNDPPYCYLWDVEQFDLHLLSSAVQLYNDLTWNPERDVADAFGWVRGVMDEAVDRGLIPGPVPWVGSPEDARIAHAALTVYLGRRGGMNNSVMPAGACFSTPVDWLFETLQGVKLAGRFGLRRTRGGDGPPFGNYVPEALSVPILTGVQACAAYVIASVGLDRHGMASWVRRCERIADPHPGHLFLDGYDRNYPSDHRVCDNCRRLIEQQKRIAPKPSAKPRKKPNSTTTRNTP